MNTPAWWPLPRDAAMGYECADEMIRWMETLVPDVIGRALRFYRVESQEAIVSVSLNAPGNLLGMRIGDGWGYPVGVMIVGMSLEDPGDLECMTLVLDLDGNLHVVNGDTLVDFDAIEDEDEFDEAA